MSRVSPRERANRAKQTLRKRLNQGINPVTVSVSGLGPAERHLVRLSAGHWLRGHGLMGSVHFDPSRKTMTVTIHGERDEEHLGSSKG